MRIRFVLFATAVLACHCGFAQLSITGSSNAISPEQIIETIFLGDGVEVTSISFEGSNQAAGFFTDGFNDIGIERGIVMGSGIVSAANQEEEQFAGNDVGGPNSDPDLDPLIDQNLGLFDVARYEIKFIPAADTLRFRYVFASEEYPQFNCSVFNDIFGFFISGPNPDGGTYNAENIALVPELTDPTGLTFTNLPVTIENVHSTTGPSCPGSFEEYYNDNTGSDFLAYGAYLDVFTAQAIVIPCQEYVMQLKIADVGDPNYDSSVFLEAKSFGTGSISVDISTVSLDGTIAEGCNSATLVVSLPDPVEQDFIVDAQIIDCDDVATQDVDYIGLPDQFIIPAGENRVEYEIFAIEDGIIEGLENICFDIQKDICNRDTVTISIVETPLEQPIIPQDTMICQAEIITLTQDLPPSFVLPPAPFFSTNESVTLIDEFTEYRMDIEVDGVFPEYIAPNLIKRVCIDSVEHIFRTDLDFYLLTPGGFFMELSTDNGFDGDNTSVDYMINTCFTPFAIENINNGTPLVGSYFPDNPKYTGDFLPEGVWEDLYDLSNESNGTYSLIFIDEEEGAIGSVHGWSICFQALYNLTYEWSSSVDGSICINCEDIDIEVDETTTFYLEVTDSYGCSLVDSFTVETVDLLPPVENLMCDSIAPQYIRVEWDAAIDATGYTIFIPGIIDPPLDIGNVTEWAISTGLDPSTSYDITITVLGGTCGGQSTTITCTTNQCEVDDLVIETLEGVSCLGDADGILDVEITGNYPPYTYTFRGTNTLDGAFSDLAASVAFEDTLYIEDNTGCIAKFPIVIPTPNALNVDFEDVMGIQCNGETSASVVAEPFGGTEPYEYIWESGSTTNTASDLGEGTEGLTVTDFNGCSIVTSISFTEPAAITATQVSSDVSCFGGNDGSAAVNPSGGTASDISDYEFAWGDPLGQTTFSVNDLPAATYIVTITDLNSCTATVEVVINQPDEIMSSVVGTDVLCFDSENGTGTVTIVGGNPPFDFEWDNGELTNPAVALNPGKHFVTITDDEDCFKIDSVIIDAPDSLLVSFMIDSVSCFDSLDGVISWDILGGVGPYETEINGVTVTSPLSDLPAGEYCFEISDDNDCSIISCVTVEQPQEILISEVITGESCFNSDDAAIDITVEFGNPPYDYSWEGPGTFTSVSEDLEGIDSGIYSVTATDSKGCAQTAVYEIIEPESIEIASEVLNIQCKGEETGFLNITVTGGTLPYEFEWIGPNGYTSDEEDIIDVFAGAYTVIVSDSNDCIAQGSFEILEPNTGVNANISEDDEVCFGATNGVASVAPSGGSAPYDITWSTGSKFTNLNGLSPGRYYVTVVDGSLCTNVDSLDIIERDQILIETDVESSLCFESFDGSAVVSQISEGGQIQNIADYTYLWTSTPNQFTAEAINLKGGQDIQLIVTDELGCTSVTEVEIPTPEAVSARLEFVDSISCALGDNGSIVIQGTGGDDSYEYQWGQGTNFQTGPAAKNLKSGNYNVTITDGNGCTGVEEFAIQDPFPITLNFRIFDVLCFGEDNGEIELIANGGTEPYSLNWSTGDNVDELTGLEIGDYYVTVTDAKDCEVVDSVTVAQPEAPLDFDIITNDVDCNNGQNGSIIIEPIGGAGNYIYSLDNFIFNGSTEQIGLKEGFYNVYVKDANGCIDSINDVQIISPAPLELDLGPDVYLNFGETYQFDPAIGNFVGSLTFKWESPDLDLLSCIDCQTPFFDAQRQASYRLVVQDGRNCIVDDFINLYIENSDAVFVPSGFTPNGDFNNDLLSVYGIEGVQVNVFRVYDRWGEVVFEDEDFEVNDTNRGWDGIFKGKEMPPGVYTWVVEAEFTNGFKDIYSGNTTLIK